MHFVRVDVTLYDAVNTIHNVIKTPNPFQDKATCMFVGVRNNNTQQIRKIKKKKKYMYVHSVVYQKYLTRLGEMIIFSPRPENYQFSQPR